MSGTPVSAKQKAIQVYKSRPRLLLLDSDVQHYAWGDTRFIPSLLGTENPQSQPYAELWMGAHPELPSRADMGELEIPLDELIASSADEILGREVSRQFAGQLPYLFKVLSAAVPLSIQSHPTKEQAQEGFARENAAGIPLSAQHRNYKDENHKPELITALTDFYGLRGFRPLEEIARVLEDAPEFRGFLSGFQPNPASLKALYERFMKLPQKEVDSFLRPIIQRLTRTDKKRPFTRRDREYWVLRADRQFSRQGNRDRGIFSIYLLDLVHLEPGEAMYLPAGILHAYLEGSAMEIMANSNNVLRGGLTSKHVDVPELLNSVKFEGSAPEILHGVQIPGTREWAYKTPFREFELRRIQVTEEEPHRNGPDHSAEILILIAADENARITVTSLDQTLHLKKGKAFLVPQALSYTIRASGAATFYKATVPAQVRTANLSEPMPFFRGHRPTSLIFGTSGLRGLVTDITDLEAYINTRGYLEYLFQMNDARESETVSIAGDLRQSTDSADRSIMRAVARAMEDAGLKVENLGRIPTPALTYYAIERGQASVMITGSHIPFDRNGIKFNKKSGEVLKEDEPGILEAVARVRREEYGRPEDASLFQDDGMFKQGASRPLPPVSDAAHHLYLQRYLDFFPGRGLEGIRIVFFQHSAVGRDLLVNLLRELGAEVLPAGRSEKFIPIDTEDIKEERIEELQRMADEAVREHGPIHALISTDGDSDRPLILGVDSEGTVRFFGGDLLGIVVAEYLSADSVSVPISANDAVDLELAKRGLKPTKTRIGSPNVIKAMMEAAAGRIAKNVVGWEANGGFLTGSTIEKGGKTLTALPTRDAALPLLAALYASVEKKCSLVNLFSELPPRFSKAGLIDQFPQETSRTLIRRFSPKDDRVQQASFEGEAVTLFFADGHAEPASQTTAAELRDIRQGLAAHFTCQQGFDDIVSINTIDGVRIYFRNGDIAHIRPSGNAPQLRIYAVADTQARSDEIVKMGLQEPDGLLRNLERAVRTRVQDLLP